MKRSLFILLSLLVSSILVLSACGSTENQEDTSEEEEEITEEVEVEDETDSVDSEEEDTSLPTEDAETESETEETVEEQETEETNEEIENTEEQREIVEENEAFRIFEPAKEASVDQEFTVRGEARVNGGTIYYEFEDGHNILDEGTADAGENDWEEFEFTIQFDEVAYHNGTVILYEENDDGSRQNQLYIPVTVE